MLIDTGSIDYEATPSARGSTFAVKGHQCSLNVVESADKFGDVIVVVLSLFSGGTISSSTEGVLEVLVLSGANLLQDVGQHGLKRLGLRIAGNNKKTFSNRELGLWLPEMDDCVVIFKHVYFIDVGKGLHT